MLTEHPTFPNKKVTVEGNRLCIPVTYGNPSGLPNKLINIIQFKYFLSIEYNCKQGHRLNKNKSKVYFTL